MSTFHSLDTLQSWLSEFAGLHDATPSEIRVIEQDGVDGADTSIAVVDDDQD